MKSASSEKYLLHVRLGIKLLVHVLLLLCEHQILIVLLLLLLLQQGLVGGWRHAPAALQRALNVQKMATVLTCICRGSIPLTCRPSRQWHRAANFPFIDGSVCQEWIHKTGEKANKL